MIYLDNHSTTRCDPDVLERMLPFFSVQYGNAASRSHALGREARDATENARAAIARWVGASPKEVLFTSGATEANNLALQGAVRASDNTAPHIVTTNVEHPSILDVCGALEGQGVRVSRVGVGSDGRVGADEVLRAVTDNTVLVSVMRVNNETGVVQPVEAIASGCHERGVPFHTDAAQAIYNPIDLGRSPFDLVSLSAHKMYGPKGVGALIVRRRPLRPLLAPIVFGGGHERGLRSGTLPVPLIVGMGVAAELATGNEAEASRVGALRDRLLDGLRSRVDGVTVHGSVAHRSPHNLNLSIAGIEAAALLMAVRKDVCLSTGSACASDRQQPSSVLDAMGLDAEAARSSLRFGLGRFTTDADISRVVDVLADAVTRLRGTDERL